MGRGLIWIQNIEVAALAGIVLKRFINSAITSLPIDGLATNKYVMYFLCKLLRAYDCMMFVLRHRDSAIRYRHDAF